MAQAAELFYSSIIMVTGNKW